MTPKEAAAMLYGNEYRNEGDNAFFDQMKAAGLVAVFGASDDLTELRGAIDDELGVDTFHVTSAGLLKSECDEGADCPYFAKLVEAAVEIEPSQEGDYTHTYVTKIPHETFDILEEGEPYCRGIVFALADVEGARA